MWIQSHTMTLALKNSHCGSNFLILKATDLGEGRVIGYRVGLILKRIKTPYSCTLYTLYVK